MSVINKMLRDLDQRQSAEPGLRQGVTSVSGAAIRPPARRKARGSRAFLIGGVLVFVLGIGLGYVWTFGLPESLRTLMEPSVQAPAMASTPAAVPAPPPEPVAAPQVVIAPPLPVASAPEVLEPVTPAPVVESRPATPPPAQPTPVLRAEPALRSARNVPATTPAVAPAAVPASAPVVSPAHVPVPRETPAQRQQLAAKETLANAQALWNSGSRDAAIDLLQEAVSSAERGAALAQVLPPLVRELARMQLAESRPGAVWALLTRLEPQLRNEADLWAVRANAAQRLGHHQDSVQSYTTALQSRPTEQRWLLGAAVSLAALGQIANAAEMADKARASGPISRDVLQYLRQMGVPVKDQ